MTITLEKGGRLTLPEHLCALFSWEEGDALSVDLTAGAVLLKKEVPGCHLCRSTRDLVRVGELALCPDCLRLLSEAEPGAVFYRR